MLIHLQTQFNLSTSKIGIILSSFDIMGVFASPLISYMGTRYNKPRIIATCGLVFVCGSIVFTLPYFLSPRYSLNNRGSSVEESDYDLCIEKNAGLNGSQAILTNPRLSFNLPLMQKRASQLRLLDNVISAPSLPNSGKTAAAEGTCDHTGGSVEWPYYLFIMGQLLMSWGSAPLFSLGITYLCDNSNENRHAIFTGEHLASSFLPFLK